MSEPPNPPGEQSELPLPLPDLPPGDADPVADGSERRLDPRSVTVARIGGLIGAAFFSIPLFGGAVSASLLGPLGLLGNLLLLGGALFLATLLFGRALFWPGLAYRHASWRLDGRGLRIRRGVIWRTEIFVPKSRVQHTDVSRGPIERGFGLAKLVMHTAGTHDASVVLGGLAEADAFALRDFLIDVDGGDAV